MVAVDRRSLLRSVLPGAIVTVASVTAIAGIGMSLVPQNTADAAPLTMDKINALRGGEAVEKAQVVIVGPRRPRRRRRRWVCWWRRGRRVCAWRYW
jgi:hypothetical protein